MQKNGNSAEVVALRDLLRRLCTWSGLRADRFSTSAIDARALLALPAVQRECARTGASAAAATVQVVRQAAAGLPVTARLIADAALALQLFAQHSAEGIETQRLYAPNLGDRRSYLIANWQALHEALGAQTIPPPPTERSIRARPELEAIGMLAGRLLMDVPADRTMQQEQVARARIPGDGIGSVVVVGEAVIDRILRVPRIPTAGTGESGRLARHPGGKGFYRAVCAAQLGLDVELIAAVGSDADSRWILEFLHRCQVGTSLVKIVEGAPAPETEVIVADDGTALYIPIAGRVRLTERDLAGRSCQSALAAAAAMLVTFEHSVEVIVAALRAARRSSAGPLVILHPSPPVGSAEHLRGLLGVIGTVDYIIGTTSELRQMLPDTFGPIDPETIAERMHGLGVAVVCVIENYRCIVRAGALRASISAARAATLEDSPGARSAFAAALAYRLALSKQPARTADFRWATAAMIATQNYLESPGAMPTVDQIDRVLHLAVEE